jgi:hypothetical protein
MGRIASSSQRCIARLIHAVMRVSHMCRPMASISDWQYLCEMLWQTAASVTALSAGGKRYLVRFPHCECQQRCPALRAAAAVTPLTATRSGLLAMRMRRKCRVAGSAARIGWAQAHRSPSQVPSVQACPQVWHRPLHTRGRLSRAQPIRFSCSHQQSRSRSRPRLMRSALT